MASFTDTLKLIVGKRWPLIFLLFVAEFVIIIGVSNLALSPSELSTYESQYNSTLVPVLNASAPSQVAAIVANNLKVSTLELIPAVGLAIFVYSLYQTARIVQAIGVVKGVGVGFALANLFFLPSTWLELPAYAIASAESAYLVYAIYRGFRRGRGYLARELRFLVVNIVLVTVVLVVAAIFEVSEIQIATALPQGPLLSLLTWIPFVVVFVLVLAFWRRARRDATTIEWKEEAPPPSAGF